MRKTDINETRLKHAFLIGFCGPDGSGKSTQLRLLAFYLTNRGFKIRYCWLRIFTGFTYYLYILLEKIGYRKLPFNNNFSKNLWFVLEIVNIIPKLLICTIIPLKLNYTVLAERHIIDTIVSMALFIYRDPKFIITKKSMFLLRLLPKNSLHICLSAKPSTVIARRLKRSSPTDIHLKNKKIRNEVLRRLYLELLLYKILIRYINGFVVDNDNTEIYLTQKRIIKIVKNYIYPQQKTVK